MTQWMQQLLWHSLAMALMVIAYNAATAALGKRYAARWFYLAGAILLIGFFIPFRPTLTVEIEKAPEFVQSLADQAGLAQPISTAIDGFPQAKAVYRGLLWQVVFMVWALGALCTLLYHGIRHMLFVHAVKRWSVEVKDAALLAQFQEAKQNLLLQNHEIVLVHCACISSPMLLWIRKPTILLPEGTSADSSTRFILLHELVHYKRKDLLVRLVMLLSTAIHWFNPAVYRLVKLVTLQCEVSCDEKVVENQDIEGRHQYALSIIGIAQCQSRGYTLLTTHFIGGKDTMKKRISSVYEPVKTKIGALLLACTLLMTALAGTSIAADTSELKYTLPEAPVKFNEKLDSYTVSWEPVEGIKEYHVGVYYNFQIEETTFVSPQKNASGAIELVESEPTTELWGIGTGWIGPNKVTDGAGKEYDVAMGIWDAVTLKGDATEVEISELINKQLDPVASKVDENYKTVENANKTALLGCTLVITAVRESGEPFVMNIELPVQ